MSLLLILECDEHGCTERLEVRDPEGQPVACAENLERGAHFIIETGWIVAEGWRWDVESLNALGEEPAAVRCPVHARG